MSDGAEAVMEENAELDDYRGKHLMQMLDSFHDRGLLVSTLKQIFTYERHQMTLVLTIM